MFEQRIWWFVIAMGAAALVVSLRLVDLQVIHAAEHATLIDKVAPRQVHYIRAPRGAIRDRNGKPLVQDQACSDVTMFYRVLIDDESYLKTVARRLRRSGGYPEKMALDQIVPELRAQIDAALQAVRRVTGVSLEELERRRDRVVTRVQRIRERVARASGMEPDADAKQWRPLIREENAWHPILEDLPPAKANELALALGDQPWIRIQPGSQRRAIDADELAHLLGRMGAASADRIAADPERDDEFRALRPGDRCGISGVERLADHVLRGTRGRIVVDPTEGPIERRDPEPGQDVRLMIDHGLQRRIYQLLADGVKLSDHPAGAAAVVIDVSTREVLAAVSYPTYRIDEYGEKYGELLRDTRLMPLKARAIQVSYPPGSTCKAIAAVGALTDGVVSVATELECTGFLLPGNTSRFRCWIYNQKGLSHGPQSIEDAIRNSCNIYFYRAGEKLGPARLCDWFERFGLGRTTGTGLIEESPGVVPDEEWLQRVAKRRFQRGDEWNWAIGQGEVNATPMQVANVAATIASGEWRPVVLARDSSGAPLGEDLPSERFDSRALRSVRTGMWRVVNEPGATAYNARLDQSIAGRYVMCGKTGSAQAQPLVLDYRFVLEWPDGRREEVIAATKEEALEPFGEDGPRVVGRFAHDRFPTLGEDGKLPAHAWFMGYTQSADVRPGDAPRGKVYAIAVIIEFGARGGAIAGPVAKKIAELMLGADVAAG
jgi:cell division protein FtsI/penicillin-binding protein 2